MVSAIHKRMPESSRSPVLFKVSAIQFLATTKRFGKNPFAGQEQWFGLKPARVKVKVRAQSRS
ncbi:hypothetical protein E1J61_15900 [Cupriavidus sp. L7L]|nr:hypothetical protein E1J61_15900 [Cupriavidus sp. L7L]